MLKLNLEDEDKQYDSNSQSDIILPRKYVSTTDENQITLEDIASYTDKKELLKKPKSAIIKYKAEKNNIPNRPNKAHSSKDLSELGRNRSKSFILIVDDKKKVAKNGKNIVNRREKRSNSVKKSEKLENFDYEKLLKENMKSKQKQEKNQNQNQSNDKYSGIRNSSSFKRKAKKSATLMETSDVIKQLFRIQMSIPVSQDMLVIHQKGNPSDKYIKGKKLGSGTFGEVYEAKNIQFNNIVAMKIIKKEENMNKLIIKNENERNKAIEKVTTELKNIGFKEIGVILSPIKGGDGNIEYLAYFRK